MMETAMGILARKPEDDRARECAVALSSGVSDSTKGLDALQWAAIHIELMYFQECGACSSGFTGRGKSSLFCHSEQSEESLFDLTHEKKERFGVVPLSETRS